MKRTENLSRRARLGILAAIMAGAFSIMPAAQAMPTGGASETATITTAGNTMDIASSVTNNLLTWQDFSIAKGETVNFQGANTYLNVVTGANESQIFGAINGSDANVFLVNPNGILIGDGAQVNVGSLHLSTADIKGSLANFDTAKAALDGVATFSGDVVNKGTLKAAQEITVDGNNITFKNTANVTSPQVTLQSTGSGEIHIGSTGGTASGYTIKKGTEIDYKLVSTAAELQNINNDLSGNYMLANDIDMNGASFTPIGKFVYQDPSYPGYTGRFDGLNYKISNMVINGDLDVEGVGLFGYVQNGTVENVGRVGGSTTGRTAVGSIVGYNVGGTIRNVYNTGTVTGKLDDQYSGGTGGIVGSSNQGTIKNVYNTGDVTTQNRAGGGIVGRLQEGTLENAYNTGTVTVNNQINSKGGAGGIIGWFDYNVTIKNVYNTGSVTGKDRAGGIAGLCDKDFGYNNKGPLTITNAYNTGEIKAGSSPGNAMVGTTVADSEVTVKDSFYTKGNGFTGATQVTEAAMKEMATFSSWGDSITNNGSSTTAAWRIYEGSTMPLLTAFMTRKDNISSAVYDGTADVGYTSKASTKTSTQAEGINWVSDVTIVSPKALTISFAPIEKTYDGTTSATAGKGTLSGVVGEDKVGYDASAVTAVYDGADVGAHTVNYSGIKLTGEKAKNYSIPSAATGNGTITPVVQPVLPTGGASGTATLTTTTKTSMDITSPVTNNLITWQDFSIGRGNTVNFHGANTYLNVVTGSNQSEIYGTLTGKDATIYLVNPSGILFGEGATIDVSSLHLSTANLQDIKDSLDNFDTAMSALGNVGYYKGNIVNKGTLTAAKEITAVGENITIKNTADVKSPKVTLTAATLGEIHIGSADGSTPANYTMNGTSHMYKLVSTPEQLQNINNDLSGNYMLANDIDMNGVSFTPIGKWSASGYSGKFDGLNYKISNMVIKGDPDVEGVGLFGYVQNGTVENVGRVGGSTTGRTSVGSIVGYNAGGTIRNVYNTGTVTGTLDDKWSGAAGGIVGANDTGTIKNVYNTGDVTTQNRAGGGIVGRLHEGTLENAYNTGKVTVNPNNSKGGAGGITGWFDKNVTIKNVYNTGSVTGKNYAGGIAGLCDKDFGFPNNGPLTITNAYNTGAIMVGSSQEGNAIVGTTGDITVKDSFYTKGSAFTGATEATEAAMKEMATFLSWGDSITNDGSSTTAVWRIYEGSTMPLLTAFMTRKDNISSAVYDGTADVGYTSKASTKTSTQAEGINWVRDVTIVSPKALTFNAADKVYDGTTKAPVEKGNLAGVIAGDDVSLSPEATGTYDGKDVGTHNIQYSGITLTGEKAKNYSIAKETTGTGTITPATLTFGAADKVYDGTTKAPVEKGNLVGVIAGDDVSLSPEATGTYDGKDAGTHNIQYSGITLTGVDAKNYSIAKETTGKGTINPAPLTFGAVDRVYDGTTKAPVEKGNLVGVIAGDDVSLSPEASGVYDGKDAGTHNIQYSGITLTGVDAKNYSIATETTGTGTITPATLTFGAADKVYDGTTKAPVEKGNLAGVIAGDDVSLSPEASGVYDGKDAGTHNIQYSGITLTGVDAKNYSIAKEITGTGTITPATLTFNAADKVYDGTTTATDVQGTLVGVVAGEDVSYEPGITAVYDGKDAGTHNVQYSGITLTGVDAKNYSIASEATGQAVIAPAQLTITFDAADKQYDGTTDAVVGKGTLTGIVGTEDVAYAADAVTAAYDSKNAGSRTVTYSGIKLTGADAGNYSIAATTEGKGTINAAPLTLKVADVTKYYDGTTDALNASYSIVGTLYGDDTLEGGVFAYTDKNVGTGKTVTLTGVTAKDGNEGGNYDLTVINSTNSSITINVPEIEAVTTTTQGDDQGNVSFGEQHTITVVFDNEGTLTLVNGGINPPNSMDAEIVAKQNKDTKSNGENKEGE